MYEEDKRDLALDNLAADILKQAQTELYLAMRFLDVALSSLRFVPDSGIRLAGTNGQAFYFQSEKICRLFETGREQVNRLYLHSILHCLFAHPWMKKDREEDLWNISCDIAIEYVIDGLLIRCVHVPKSALKREIYRNLPKTPTAQNIYRMLKDADLNKEERLEIARTFLVDDHSRWEEGAKSTASKTRQSWDDMRDRMQTELSTFGKDASDDVKSLAEEIRAENRRKYDYREFLRKFSVLKEEMQVDPDSFDYIYYNYGMELYGNMPIIEPLETREVQKIEDFIIVLDTSMSCSGPLLKKFLEQTYSILSESESFYRKIVIHIIQCDDRVEEDVLITNEKEMKHYLEHFTVRGFGGTDFRPAFAYVEELLKRKCFTKLRGLIYFTDGYGTFPAKKPPYDTAFVFFQEDYCDVDVPPWAIKLILQDEDLRED